MEKIIMQAPNEKYRQNYDEIFGKKEDEPLGFFLPEVEREQMLKLIDALRMVNYEDFAVFFEKLGEDDFKKINYVFHKTENCCDFLYMSFNWQAINKKMGLSKWSKYCVSAYNGLSEAGL